MRTIPNIASKKDLFGWRCSIPTGMKGRPFVYRIIRSGVKSNAWVDTPIMAQKNRQIHDESKSVLFVVIDTLIDDKSKIICVAEDDVELIPPPLPTYV